MKKIILGTIISASLAVAEVITIVPYGGTIDYANDRASSAKDEAILLGAHASIGTLSYLVEADYSHINTKYKDRKTTDLSQDDISLTYTRYFKNTMYKVGGHYISTNDKQLGDGMVVIAAIGGYNYFKDDKLSYGIDGFFSYYDKGHDENYIPKSIFITQFSPYLSYYKSINKAWGNTLVIKTHYQIANDYVKNSYSSYEISDTIYYNSLFLTLKYYDGEMRTGVKDGGFTVYNTLDLIKSGYSTKLGYYLTKDVLISASYSQNNYVEYDHIKENTNRVAIASLSYSF